jgi:hypothetical protein
MNGRAFNLLATVSLLLFVAVAILRIATWHHDVGLTVDHASLYLESTRPYTHAIAGTPIWPTFLNEPDGCFGFWDADISARHPSRKGEWRTRWYHFLGFRIYEVFAVYEEGTVVWSVGQRWLIVIPLWAILAATGPLATIPLFGFITRRRRQTSRRCLACGYDLRATPDRCPECGTTVQKPVETPT